MMKTHFFIDYYYYYDLCTVKLNGKRHVIGVLRGFDQFMNITLDQTVEVVAPGEQREIGMVIIRGNSIELLECLEPLEIRK